MKFPPPYVARYSPPYGKPDKECPPWVLWAVIGLVACAAWLASPLVVGVIGIARKVW